MITQVIHQLKGVLVMETSGVVRLGLIKDEPQPGRRYQVTKWGTQGLDHTVVNIRCSLVFG